MKMGKFDDIDKLIKPAASWVKAREALSRGKFKRIYVKMEEIRNLK